MPPSSALHAQDSGERREESRARGASGVPQARLVRVFLTAKGACQSGAPLGDFLSDPSRQRQQQRYRRKASKLARLGSRFKRPSRLL